MLEHGVCELLVVCVKDIDTFCQNITKTIGKRILFDLLDFTTSLSIPRGFTPTENKPRTLLNLPEEKHWFENLSL